MISPARALELKDIRIVDAEADLLGGTPVSLSELNRNLAVPVPAGVHVRRFRVEAGANDQAHLAVRIAARTHEFREGLDNQVALHLLPCELALVMIGPHVRAGCRKEVLLGVSVIGRAARDADPADVPMLLKNADRRGFVARPGGVRGRDGAGAEQGREEGEL